MRIAVASAILIAGVSMFTGTCDAAEDPPRPDDSAAVASEVEEGPIAWYGKKFAGRRTASGERFDPEALTMAHPRLPFGTQVRVTNLSNGKSVTVRVNDRGPTVPSRIADVSTAAARELEMIEAGVVEARLEVLE